MFALQVPFFLVGTLFVRLAFALQRSKVLLWGALISVPLNIVLNWVFRKRFGAAGLPSQLHVSISCPRFFCGSWSSDHYDLLAWRRPVSEQAHRQPIEVKEGVAAKGRNREMANHK